jgi:predicted dehydrogenase
MKKTPSKSVRVGVIGIGGMGGGHAKSLQEGRIAGATLEAVSDISIDHLAKWQGVATFTDAEKMIRSGKIDAVVIGTPHFSHAPLSIAALKGGLHVLVEKPITVRKADAEEIIAAHRKTDRVFAIMFNQRTDPLYLTLREWISDGTLGRIQRIQWTITDWFRPHAYYVAGSWRGTWAGEGGGILMNQAPHQLDLWQWLFGMPARVRAIGGTGRYHAIEVEDDVTALFEYANGTTGVFISTTGEAPGINRLEIAGDNGLAIVDGRTLRFLKNDIPTSEFSRTTQNKFAKPPFKEEVLEIKEAGPQHAGILQNFVDAILTGKPLIAPGAEGIKSLELANAATISMFTNKPVDLPMKSGDFTKMLDLLIRKSKAKAAPKKKKAAAKKR